MAQRESSVKLTLSNSQFLAGIKRAGDAVQRMGRSSVLSSKHMGAGFKQVGKDLGGMASKAKSALKMIGSLGGAFTAGAALKNANELNGIYSTLAFRVQTARKEMTKGADIQQIVERSAAKTTRTSEEMAEAFETVFGATKDLEFTKEVLGAIGDTATATNESIESIATVSHAMQRKFGLNAGEVREALAQVYEQAQQGGPSFEGFAEAIDVLGSNLVQAGMKGKQGLNFLLGSLNATDAGFENLGEQIGGIKNLMIKLANTAEMEGIAEETGLGKKLINEKDAIKRLKMVLAVGQKGMTALGKKFMGPDEQKALRILFTEPFNEALQRAKAGGLRGKEATEQALRSLDDSIAKFGQTTLTAADMQAQAAKRATSPQARLRVSVERLNQAFASPEIIDAIEQLSMHLPAVAGIFADFVKFAAQNPVLAGALGLSASVARSFLTGMVTSIVSGHATGGAGAATAITQAHVVGGMKVGNLIKGAGAFAAIAIAGAVAAEKIGKDADANAQATGGIAVARAKLASRSGSLKKNREEARFAEKAIAAKEKELGSLSNTLFMSGDQRKKEERELAEAREDLKWKKAHIAKLEAEGPKAAPAPAAMPSPTTTPAPAPGSGKGRVNLDDRSTRDIGRAVQAAVTGGVLSVRIVDGGMTIGGGGRGGSRGPMVIGQPATLGGV